MLKNQNIIKHKIRKMIIEKKSERDEKEIIYHLEKIKNNDFYFLEEQEYNRFYNLAFSSLVEKGCHRTIGWFLENGYKPKKINLILEINGIESKEKLFSLVLWLELVHNSLNYHKKTERILQDSGFLAENLTTISDIIHL